MRKDLHLVVALPKEELPPEAGKIIPEIIHRHFAFHSGHVRHDLVISWREGIYSLIITLVNALVAILIFYLLDKFGIQH